MSVRFVQDSKLPGRTDGARTESAAAAGGGDGALRGAGRRQLALPAAAVLKRRLRRVVTAAPTLPDPWVREPTLKKTLPEISVGTAWRFIGLTVIWLMDQE